MMRDDDSSSSLCFAKKFLQARHGTRVNFRRMAGCPLSKRWPVPDPLKIRHHSRRDSPRDRPVAQKGEIRPEGGAKNRAATNFKRPVLEHMDICAGSFFDELFRKAGEAVAIELVVSQDINHRLVW